MLNTQVLQGHESCLPNQAAASLLHSIFLILAEDLPDYRESRYDTTHSGIAVSQSLAVTPIEAEMIPSSNQEAI